MPRRRWLTLIAVCLLISPIGFAVGHWSKSNARHSSVPEQHRVSDALEERKATPLGEATDYSSVSIENLGQVDFDQAMALLDSAPKEALSAWAKRLESLPVGPRRTAGVAAFFKTLAQIDTRTAVDLALGLKVQESRWIAIGSIANAAPAADLDEVARMYIALDEKKLGLGDFVMNWSRTDPAATGQFLSNYRGEVENSVIAPLMVSWAALDPVAAEEWLAKNPGRRDAEVRAAFYSGWLEHDRAAALNDLRMRVHDEGFNKAIEAVSEDLFKNSEGETRAFILTLSPAAQETAVGSIIHDVTALYLSGGPDLQADQVAKWLVTLPEKLWKDQLGEVLHRWVGEDQSEREAWIGQLPVNTRDTVLASYCRAYRLHEPADNLRAGLRISDPNLRRETFRDLFRDMEEEARQELLVNAQLSQPELEELAGILTGP